MILFNRFADCDGGCPTRVRLHLRMGIMSTYTGYSAREGALDEGASEIVGPRDSASELAAGLEFGPELHPCRSFMESGTNRGQRGRRLGLSTVSLRAGIPAPERRL